jgi:hypothetical protein
VPRHRSVSLRDSHARSALIRVRKVQGEIALWNCDLVMAMFLVSSYADTTIGLAYQVPGVASRR